MYATKPDRLWPCRFLQGALTLLFSGPQNSSRSLTQLLILTLLVFWRNSGRSLTRANWSNCCKLLRYARLCPICMYAPLFKTQFTVTFSRILNFILYRASDSYICRHITDWIPHVFHLSYISYLFVSYFSFSYFSFFASKCDPAADRHIQTESLIFQIS